MAQPALSGIGLRAGKATLPATAPEAELRAFVAAANAAARIDGLPDALNASILDPGKVVRLVAGLPYLPATTLARLSGHDLLLDDPGLQASAAYPSGPLDARFGLEITQTRGRFIQARIDARPDAARARARAEEAAAALPPIEAEIARLEQANQDPRIAKERRQAVARLWRMAARAWSEAAPSDAEATKAAADSDAAARAAALPPRGGTLPD